MTPPAPSFVDFFAGSGMAAGRWLRTPRIVTVWWICRLVFLQAPGAFVLTGHATLAVF
jgi:hypothetical protein